MRPARALPYVLDASGTLSVADGTFRIGFPNTGDATVVYQVRSGSNADSPRVYAVEPGKSLSDSWEVKMTGVVDYDLTVYGPTGFLRAFKDVIRGRGRPVWT